MLPRGINVDVIRSLRSARVVHEDDDRLLVAVSHEVGVAHRLEREPFVLPYSLPSPTALEIFVRWNRQQGGWFFVWWRGSLEYLAIRGCRDRAGVRSEDR